MIAQQVSDGTDQSGCLVVSLAMFVGNTRGRTGSAVSVPKA